MKPKGKLLRLACLCQILIPLIACNSLQPSTETLITEEPTSPPTEDQVPQIANAATAIAASGVTEWNLVIVGDSLVAEEWSSLPDQYAEYIETDLGVEIQINDLGSGGLTCKSFLPSLQKYAFNREPLQEAHIILVSLGGGDLLLAGKQFFQQECNETAERGCLDVALAEFKDCWDGFLKELISLADPGDTLIRIIITGAFFQQYADAENYETFVDFQDDFYTYQIQSSEAAGITLLDLYHFEEPDDFRMGDQIHVSQAGKALIAKMLHDLGYDYK